MTAPDFARELVQASLDALYVVTPEGKIVHWNWGAENQYGWPASEAQGRFLHELIVTPEAWDAERASLREAVATGSAIGEKKRRKRDGTVLDVQVVQRAFRVGEDAFVATSERDVTDAKRLEAEAFEKVWSLTEVQNFLHSILEGSEDHSIIAMDLTGRIEAWNRGARRDFGHDTVEALGKHGPALIHVPEDFAAGHVDRALRTALETGKFESEFTCRRKNGTRFPAKLTISVRKDAYEKPVGYVIIARDVTEEKFAAEAHAKAVAQAAELSRLRDMDSFKTRFINTAAHELGTPLTPIKVQLHALKADRTLSERQRKSVEILDRNVARLAALVKDVLDVARLQSGELPVRTKVVDLAQLARDAVESFEAAARERGLALRLVAPAALDVEADPERIMQVFYNLLGNALKFTPGNGRIDVDVSRTERGALVTFRDTGVGLTPEQQDKLFQPFSQAHDNLERTDAGAGLGLYISKGIVESHGGRLWVESGGEGKGATFSVLLPASRLR